MAGNNITIVGNITRDPELRYTPSGQANVQNAVAMNCRRRIPGPRDTSDWRTVTRWAAPKKPYVRRDRVALVETGGLFAGLARP